MFFLILNKNYFFENLRAHIMALDISKVMVSKMKIILHTNLSGKCKIKFFHVKYYFFKNRL